MSEIWVTPNLEAEINPLIFAVVLLIIATNMDFSNYVKEFRVLQKTQRIRVADFCRERMLDYFEMVEALKKDKFLSEMPDEKVEAAELEVTNLPLDHPDPAAASFIQEVSIQTPTHLKVRICGITASDLITVVSKLMTIRPC